jgi:HEAT repeat protein
LLKPEKVESPDVGYYEGHRSNFSLCAADLACYGHAAMKKTFSLIQSVALAGLVASGWVGCSKEEPGAWGTRAVDVSAQIQALKTGDDNAKAEALSNLAQAGPNAAPAVQLIIDTIKDSKDPVLVRLGAYALGQIGLPAAKPAVPVLKQLMSFPNREVGTVVFNALNALDPTAIPANIRPPNVQTAQ